MNTTNPEKIVGLAISGGWIRAAAAIGAAEVLLENGIEVRLVSGCSAGSVVAACLASGRLDVLKKRLMKGSLKDYIQIMFRPTNPKNGLFNNHGVVEFWREMVADKKFEDLDKKLFLTATDLNSYAPVVLRSGPIAEAIQACVNLPGMFVPFKLGDKILSDGGNFNLIPSKSLYDNGANYVIAIDVTKRPNSITRLLADYRRLAGMNRGAAPNNRPTRHPNALNLIYRALKISSLQIANFFSVNYPYDIMIKPDINHIKRWDIGKIDYLIKRGREAALRQIVQIKHDLGLWQ